MKTPEPPSDEHAARREALRRRARYGMRVRGASARLLGRLASAPETPPRSRKRKPARRKRT